MMERSYYSKEMEDYLSVVDVYDSAALIGKDFEYLIEQYGVEAVTELMPKVIRVLEQLEFLASKNEKENDELMQLELTIKRLNSEKEERTKERQRYEQELEQIEESYRKETKDLCQMVANLQDQNKRLQARLNENSTGQEAAVEKTEEDFNVIQSLKETINKQRGQIKGLQTEVKHKESEVNTIQTHVERLTQETVSLRSASSSFKSEAEHLLKEQATLQHTLKEKDTQIISIRETISQQEKSLNDSIGTQVSQLSNAMRDTKVMTHIKTMQAKHLIDEKSELQSLLQDRDQQLRIYQEKHQHDESSTEKTNIIGQVVGNVKDPDNPRFTLNELKDVLTERNTLKSKLIEIEEELSYYKSKDKPIDDTDTSSSWQAEQVVSDPLEESYSGDVQGPLPPEPWEKHMNKPESGIRKFFERFPVELPETIKVNLVPGEFASYAQARASSFWDLRMSRSQTAAPDVVGRSSTRRAERPKSEFMTSTNPNI